MALNRPFLSVIVPAYNEADHLEHTMEGVSNFLAVRYPDHETIVVDDGSSDSTPRIIGALAHRFPRLRAVYLPHNRGKGAAVRAGIRAAEGQWIAVIDADFEIPITALVEFFAVQARTGAAVVVGSKHHPQSEIHYPLSRRALSRAYHSLIQMAFWLPVSDTQVGFKLFHRDTLKVVSTRLLVKRFAYDVELLSVQHRLGVTFAEAPVRIDYRRTGLGRIRGTTILNMVRETAGVWYRLKVRHWYDPLLNEPVPSRIRPLETLTPEAVRP